MDFPVVEIGYDQREIDSCLNGLGERLARLVAKAEVDAKVRMELDPLRGELDRLRGLLSGRPAGDAGDPASEVAAARRQAAEILTRARNTLAAAHVEARNVRERVYSEAMQARRDFEAALYARRQRETRVDEILRHVSIPGLLNDELPPAETRASARAA